MAHPGGRPLKFKTVEELQEKIDAYFASCDSHVEEVTEWVEAREPSGKLLKDANGLSYLTEVTHMVMTKAIPYTITGLALFLDTSRETLLDYEKGKHDSGEDIEGFNAKFSDTIKKAKLKCQSYAEASLFTNSPTGSIFNLKNNYGWKDKTEQDITSGGEKLNNRPYEGLTKEQLLEALKKGKTSADPNNG